MQATNTRPRFDVTADAHGICSHAGVVLLAELAGRLGLTSELGRRANLGLARPGGSHAHDRGAVLRDLVVMLADGGDCLSDLASLRDQAGLFGRVCSTPTAWRVVGQVAADPRGVAALWSALARVRARAWALGPAPTGPLTIDLDATLVGAHADQQGARPTYKHGFGFQCAMRRLVVSPTQKGGTWRNCSWVQWLTPIRNGDGDKSMPEKRRSRSGVRGDAPRDPRDMAKAGLPDSQSPDDATNHPPERRPKPAPRPASA